MKEQKSILNTSSIPILLVTAPRTWLPRDQIRPNRGLSLVEGKVWAQSYREIKDGTIHTVCVMAFKEGHYMYI